MICANACGEMKLVTQEKTVSVKDVNITAASTFYLCPVCGLEAGTIEQAGAFQKVLLDKYNALIDEGI